MSHLFYLWLQVQVTPLVGIWWPRPLCPAAQWSDPPRSRPTSKGSLPRRSSWPGRLWPVSRELSIYLSIYSFTYLFIYLSIYLYLYIISVAEPEPQEAALFGRSRSRNNYTFSGSGSGSGSGSSSGKSPIKVFSYTAIFFLNNDIFITRVADPVGSGMFSSDPDPVLSFRIWIWPI